MWESGFLDTLRAGSFAALAAIHQQLFAGIDDLAGQLRTVNLGRGNGHFIPALELRAALAHIERMPQAGLDDILAKYLAMNLAHPFPRGNGRSMRIWLDLMLKRELGRVVDWSAIDWDGYLQAMAHSPLNAAAVRHILQGALSDAVADQGLYMQGIDASFACREAAADPFGTAGPPATGGAARQRACPLCGTLCAGRSAVCPDCGRSAA